MSDYGHELEFGVFVTPSAQAAESAVALATLADRAGLDLVSWTLLSFVAARTRRVRVTANVLNLPLRQPAVVARAVALNVSGTLSGSGGGPLDGPPAQWVEELTRFALEDGVGSFILMTDDPTMIQTFAVEVAPAVREQVAAARAAGDGGPARTDRPAGTAAVADIADADLPAQAGDEETSEYDRLGVIPTPDDGRRRSATVGWDESTRPRRPRPGPVVTYTDRGRLVGRHLIDVHDMLRNELGELREILGQVRDGALGAGDARSALDELALRRNDWTLGAFCSRYCGAVAQHHGLEDDAIFPHLARSDAGIAPVTERLADEHLVIHDAIQDVDRALVDHINHPDDYDRIEAAIDFLTDSLLSHLSYEEHELVEPFARLGFYPGQL